MSIADELALLANTKEGLRVSLELSEDVPFSQYAAYIPWGSEGVPAAGSVFDFSNNRYAKDGRAAYLTDMPSQFTRLSNATMWKSDKVLDVPENTPRINTDGLLIEPQRTNHFIYSSMQSVTAAFNLQGAASFCADGICFASEGAASYYGRVLGVSTPSLASSVSIYSKGVKPIIHPDTGREFFLWSNKILQPAVTTNVSSDVWRSTAVDVDTAQGIQYPMTGANRPASYSMREITFIFTQLEIGSTPTSAIKTTSAPVTRAKETLVIPFAAGQTVTADKDAGVTMTIVDNNAVFEGQGYIRSVRVN